MSIFKKIKESIFPHEEPRKHEVDSFTVYVMDVVELRKKYKEINPDSIKQPYGFYRPFTGDIYVCYDYNKKDKYGKYIPNQYVLGHELLEKMLHITDGGCFHQ